MDLFCLPPHPPNPFRPILNILSLTNPINSKPLPSQFLVTRHAMYETMTRPTKPRNAV